MAESEKTVWENGETVYDSEETVLDSGKMVPDDATLYDDAESPSQAGNEVIIKKGNTLLDTYRIESNVIEGGMGKVWRVHHESWNVDLAMKQPKTELFQTKKQKENFTHECEAWINLGLHPHIVSCYYVREIDDTPTIFSEWMDGGSLKNIIEDGSLYSDGVEERILDIAIQFAHGLHYAHEQGFIHQDVKAENLLLTKNGEAKVADFGIAKARATVTLLDANMPENGTMFSMSGGYTHAYVSIEQVRGEKLTRSTDINSWAVSVMEMYLGERPWQNGVIAGAACESYFPKARMAIPKDMKTLLKECLNEDEVQRPHDFSKVEKRLLGIYKDIYARTQPKAAADTADSLNNRALSFIDLGRPEDAKKCWEKALILESKHPEAVTNYTLQLWRSGVIDDLEAVRRMQVLHQNKGTWQSEYSIAKFHMERVDRESAVKILTDVLVKSSDNADVKSALELVSDEKSGWRVTRIFQEHGIDEYKCFSPDGQKIISRSKETENNFALKVQDLKTGEVLQTFSGHKYQIIYTCSSPDGSNVLSCDLDETKLWDIKSDECIDTFPGFRYAYDISPDGNYALFARYGKSSYFSKSLELWNMKTLEYLREFTSNYDFMTAQFSLDGDYIIAGCQDGTIYFWRLDYEYEFPGWADWDEGACPYLEIFLALHPEWTEADYDELIIDLQRHGYGWLRPEGVRTKLEEMQSK